MLCNSTAPSISLVVWLLSVIYPAPEHLFSPWTKLPGTFCSRGEGTNKSGGVITRADEDVTVLEPSKRECSSHRGPYSVYIYICVCCLCVCVCVCVCMFVENCTLRQSEKVFCCTSRPYSCFFFYLWKNSKREVNKMGDWAAWCRKEERRIIEMIG